MKWYDKTSSPKERYHFEAMMEFLKQDLKSRETCKLLNEARSDSVSKTANMPYRAKSATTALFNKAKPERNDGCPVCRRERHPLWKCSYFMGMSPAQRCAAVRRHGFCYNCLSDRHTVAACLSKNVCQTCERKHHSLICTIPKTQDRAAGKETSERRNNTENRHETSQNCLVLTPATGMSALGKTSAPSILLQVLKLQISNPSTGQTKEIFALFDSGATHSWLLRSLAEELGLEKKEKGTFSLQTFGGGAREVNSTQVLCCLRGNEGTPASH